LLLPCFFTQVANYSDKWYSKSMGKEQQISTWIFIMLTAFRKRFGMSQAVFLSIIKKYRVVHFLAEQYELLHYYDNDYITDDIVKYIKEQDGSINELYGTA